MFAVADTERLVADQVITPDQAKAIESRAREAMVVLGVNTLLCFGIIAATAGLIFWLASPVAVAVGGLLALGAGIAILVLGGSMVRIFGNAATLIGSGMLIGGASLELIDKHRGIAGMSMLLAGAVIAIAAALLMVRLPANDRFVVGAILLMGLGMHIWGAGFLLDQHGVQGLPVSLFYLYAAALMASAGWFTNVRLVTALAIIPFAQVLDTSTSYFHAAYVFYSPEPTLSILQMSVLIGACLWVARTAAERNARHARVLAVVAFVTANLCALVGSLWGDVVGLTVWGPGRDWWQKGVTYEQFKSAEATYKANALVLSADVYSILWAVALAAIVLIAAHRNSRGLFNAALTFGVIHAYTQLFESFASEPLAYVIGGLAAIPLAWGMWRLNGWIAAKGKSTPV